MYRDEEAEADGQQWWVAEHSGDQPRARPALMAGCGVTETGGDSENSEQEDRRLDQSVVDGGHAECIVAEQRYGQGQAEVTGVAVHRHGNEGADAGAGQVLCRPAKPPGP